MHAFLIIEHARQRNDELRREAARARLARSSIGTGAGSTRRRIARALVAIGYLCVAAGRSVGAGEEISDGACAPS